MPSGYENSPDSGGPEPQLEWHHFGRYSGGHHFAVLLLLGLLIP